MEAHEAETLAGHRKRLLDAVPWCEPMLRALERDEFTITQISRHHERVWFVRTSPPSEVQIGFGLAPELLIVIVRGLLQAATVRAASEQVIRSGLRLDGNLLVICDDDAESLRERLQLIGGHEQRIAWVPSGSTWPPLVEVLRRELPSFDAYEERDPVRGAQLIGRETEVAELRTRIVRGEAVGLFGLRKVGKTSVMRAVTDWLDPASGSRERVEDGARSSSVAVVLDAGVLIERTVDELGEELLRTLERRMRAAAEPMPLHRSGGRSAGRSGGLVAWKAAGEALLDSGQRLCIVIDEFDLLFEGEAGEPPIPQLNRLFRLIRGWAQMYQGQVSLVLVGRDSTFLSVPELDGVTNALLMWCTPMWLGPLTPNNATELLRKTGKRVGLDVGPISAREALRWTGGHPLLHRQFGSALRAVVREQTRDWKAKTDPWVSSTLEPYKARSAVQEVMREIVALLSKRHRESYRLLRKLAAGREWEQLTGTQGDAAQTLINFGIVQPDGSISETLRWYLTAMSPAARVCKVGT